MTPCHDQIAVENAAAFASLGNVLIGNAFVIDDIARSILWRHEKDEQKIIKKSNRISRRIFANPTRKYRLCYIK
jgi:hypothetical protein